MRARSGSLIPQRRLSAPPKPQRQNSLKRVLSRRSVTGNDFRARWTVRIHAATAVPVNNTTVFVHWQALGLEGDSKMVMVLENACRWSGESVVLESVLDQREPADMVLEMREDVLVRSLRGKERKVLGTGVLNLRKLDRGLLNQRVVIPLMRPGSKDRAVHLELYVDAPAPMTAAQLMDAVAVRYNCCDDAFLTTAMRECPLEEGEGIRRLRAKWPGVRDAFERTLRTAAPHARTRWLAYWVQVARELDAAAGEAARELCNRAVERAQQGRGLDGILAALRFARWEDAAILEWGKSLARETASRAVEPILSGNASEGYRANAQVRLEMLRVWLLQCEVVAAAADLLVNAIDRCADE